MPARITGPPRGESVFVLLRRVEDLGLSWPGEARRACRIRSRSTCLQAAFGPSSRPSRAVHRGRASAGGPPR